LMTINSLDSNKLNKLSISISTSTEAENNFNKTSNSLFLV
jgi:hypothetical protein